MRILLVSQMYPGPDAPELGTFVADLEGALRERGHELERAVVNQRGGHRRHAALARDVVVAARRFRPDVAYAHFLVPAGLLAVIAARAPTVVTAHGQDVENAVRSRVARAATRLAIRRAAGVIAVSRRGWRPWRPRRKGESRWSTAASTSTASCPATPRPHAQNLAGCHGGRRSSAPAR